MGLHPEFVMVPSKYPPLCVVFLQSRIFVGHNLHKGEGAVVVWPEIPAVGVG